jgi:hypothetical protein
VFVHITAVERADMRLLMGGQKVSFEILTERGKQAGGQSPASVMIERRISRQGSPAATPGFFTLGRR